MKLLKRLARVAAVLSIIGTGVMLFAVPALADSTPVTATGTVTSINGNDFEITDALGAIIKIDAGPDWYMPITLVLGDTVTITGELDLGPDGIGTQEIDAFTITVGADPETATVITIREGPGKPPWAGGPNGNGNGPPVDTDDDVDVDDDVDLDEDDTLSVSPTTQNPNSNTIGSNESGNNGNGKGNGKGNKNK